MELNEYGLLILQLARISF